MATLTPKGLYIPSCTWHAAPFPKIIYVYDRLFLFIGNKLLIIFPDISVNPYDVIWISCFKNLNPSFPI